MSGISVIIPTYNGEATLRQLFPALAKQTEKGFELIVIDSSSRDGSTVLAKEAGAKLIVIDQAEFDHGGTRNRAAAEAAGDILVFLTQDAVPADDSALAHLLAPLRADASVSAVFGRQLPATDAGPFAEHLRLFNYPDASFVRTLADKERFGLKTAFFSDSFSAYRRSSFEGAGRFLSGLLFGEDTCMAAKILLAGGKTAYAADARVRHSHNYTIRQDFRRYFDIGAFHTMQTWLLDAFGKAESEGFRYVISEVKFLLSKGKWHLLPSAALRTAGKLFGYKFGRAFRKLPRGLVESLSMHRFWWKKRPGAL